MKRPTSTGLLITRTTGTSHDQLNQIEAEFIEGIEAFLRDTRNRPVDIVTKFFEYIRETATCATPCSAPEDIAFEDKVLQIIRGVVSNHGMSQTLTPARCTTTSTPTRSGSVGSSKNGSVTKPENSARDMAKLVLSLTEKGIGGSLK